MRLAFVFLLTLVFISCSNNKESLTNFKPIFHLSDSTTHKIPDKQKFTFGYLEVLENRKNPSSGTIKLPVYIFRSRGENSKKDPIIYTVGGPGYSSMRASQYMKVYKYLDDRDFILFEQRGTQYAQPNLDCPEWSEAIYTSGLPRFDQNKTDSLFESAAKRCKERLQKRGIDLNTYNTNEIAADIEDLRKVLGIKKYNFLSMSYSTKIAQVLIRDYPKSIRSVVMDSPLPLESNYDEESVSNLMDVTEKILSDCRVNAKCNGEFPNLKERFYQYLREKTKDPLVVYVKNPNTKDTETFYLKGEDLISIVTSTRVSDIPFEIDKLLKGDMSKIKKQLSYLFSSSGPGNGIGMRLSVWCSEEYPFVSQSKVIEQSNKYKEVEGLSSAVFSEEVCKIWGVKKVADIENKPVQSDIPVLLISGEYDSQTPVSWARDMIKNLPNGYHVIFKGWTHGPTTNWGNPCAMIAANNFFNRPYQDPSPECIEAIRTPKFKTKKTAK